MSSYREDIKNYTKDIERLMALQTATGSLIKRGGTVWHASTMAKIEAMLDDDILWFLDYYAKGWNSDDTPGVPDNRRDRVHRAAGLAWSELYRSRETCKELQECSIEISGGVLIHRWIWEAGARGLWDNGHFGEAVLRAAIGINDATQKKTGLYSLSETALFNTLYSSDRTPKANQPRLILLRDDGTPTADSKRRGVRALAEACYGLIRNPLSHSMVDLDKHDAIEQMVALSMLARHTDYSDVVELD